MTYLIAWALAVFAGLSLADAPDDRAKSGDLVRSFEQYVDQEGSGAAFVNRGPGYEVRLDTESASVVFDDGTSLRVDFETSVPAPGLVGIEPFAGKAHTLSRTGIPLFAAVRYADLHPGTALDVRVTDAGVVLALRSAPGAYAGAIRWAVEGAMDVSAIDDATAVVKTDGGAMSLAVQGGAVRRLSSGALELIFDAIAAGTSPARSIEIAISIDRAESAPPSADPVRLAVGADGSLFVAGRLRAHGATASAFVERLAADRASLVWVSRFPIREDDRVRAIAVNDTGRIIVRGEGEAGAWTATLAADGAAVSVETAPGVEPDDHPSPTVASRWGRSARVDATAGAFEAGTIVAGTTSERRLPGATIVAPTELGDSAFLAWLPATPDDPRAAGCPGTINFDNSAGTGAWTTANNWDLDRLPNASDDVCIGAGFSVALSSGTQSIQSLTTDASATLTLSTGTLTIASASTIGGALSMSSGTLGGAGEVTIAGLFTWTAGTLAGGGTTNANGGIAISGSSFKDLNPRTLHNVGTVVWAGTGGIRLGGGATIQNDGLWDVQGNAAVSTFPGGGTFANAGTFRKSAGTGTTSFAVPFDSPGGIDVQSGTLSLNTGGTASGSITGSPGATMRFGGATYMLTAASSVSVAAAAFDAGTVNVNGAYTATSVTSVSGAVVNFTATANVTSIGPSLSIDAGAANFNSGETIAPATMTMAGGTLSGADTVNVSGLFTWTGGTMAGGGTTNANGGIAISGTGFKDLNPRTLHNVGTAVWAATGGIRLGGGCTIQNDGLWDAQGDASMTFFAGSGTFTNAGTFRKSAGTGTTAFTIPFNSPGGIEIQAGTLSLNAGGTASGSITGSPGATLRIGAGVYTLSSASSVSVSAASFDGGTVNVNGAYAATSVTSVSGAVVNFTPTANLTSIGSSLTIDAGAANFDSGETIAPATLTMSGGTLSGADTVNVSGLFTWTGGTMAGGGTTNANGGIAISGTGFKDLNPRTLHNVGTAVWAATGGIRLGGGCTIQNDGLWDAQGDASMSSFAGSGTFANAGTFRKSAGIGETTIGIPLDSSGGIEIQSGLLTLSGGGTATGTIAGSPGTTLRFTAGTYNLAASSNVGIAAASFDSGTVHVGGAYAATTSTTVGGIVNFTSTSTVTSIGSSLAVSTGAANFNSGETIAPATLTMSGGTLAGADTVSVSGLFTWSGGTLAGGGTTNANGGIAMSGNGFKDLNPRTLHNVGTAVWAGTGGVRLGAASSIQNDGLWDAQADATVSDLPGSGSFMNSGTFRKSAGGGTSAISIPFSSPGGVEVKTGTLALGAGGTVSGTITGDPGTTLRFTSGVYTLTAASSVSIPAISIDAGTLNVNGTYAATAGTTVNANASFTPTSNVVSIGGSLSITSGTATFDSGETIAPTTMTLSGGILTGADTVTVSGLTAWSAGQMGGGGTTHTNGGIAFSTSSPKDLNPRTLHNAGTAAWADAGNVRLGAGSSIQNDGIWDAQGDASIAILVGGGSFANAGTFRKSGGAATTSFAVPFTNSGAVEAFAQTIAFSSGFTQTAGSTTLNGGTITCPTPLILQGGSFRGAGTTPASVIASGTTSPGLSPAILGVGGNWTESPSSSFTVELGGLTPGAQHDRLDVAGTAGIDGALTAVLIAGYTPVAGDAFTVLTFGARSGTFATTQLPALNPGLVWNVNYKPSSVELKVVPLPSGRTPGDAATEPPLTVTKSGTNVSLAWSASCLPTDSDFEVYEGAMGTFTSHIPVGCSTAGATSWTLTPGSGSRYYLVVPTNLAGEGSYGLNRAGAERPVSASACRMQSIAACP